MTDEDTNSIGWSGSTSCLRASRSNDEGGEEESNIAGTIAGSIVASVMFIIIIVCLIIFLVWYCIRRKRKHINATNVSGSYICSYVRTSYRQLHNVSISIRINLRLHYNTGYA